ncbi:MAG TPA: transporter substrate-binding domain-containing protein, partial [Geobacterales bacterium]|nr:transporter substrate-binding domain-containing protein [Geobacterales bacterium]
MNHEGKRMGRLVLKRCLIIGTVLTILAAALFSLRVSRAHQESPRLPQLTKAEKEWLSHHPVIRLAPDPEFRPIEFFDPQGKYDGVAADHIRLLEQKLGIRFTIVRLSNWDQVMEQFQKHDVDLIGAIAPTPRRQQMMRFTAPLLTVPGGIFVRAGSDQTLTLADLKGMRVAVVSNYMAHDYLKNEHPDILLDVVPDTATGLNRVSLGVDDAYVENLATAVYYLQRQGISNLRLAGQTDFPYSWAMGVRSDWPELQGVLNKGLLAISEDERQKILNRWIYVAEVEWRPSHLQISLAVAALLATLLVA